MKFLVDVDLGTNQLLNFVVQGAGSDPGTGKPGQVYYNTGSGVLKVCTNATGPVWTTLSSGGGTVTAVSVATANGFAGSSSGGTTPALTLTTSVNGLVKGNGTALSAAVAGTDFVGPTSGSSIQKASSGGLTAAVAGTDYLAPAGNGSALTGLTISQISGGAPLASPTFTGVPAAPTASAGTSTTQLATTAFVTAAVSAAVQGLNVKNSAVAATVGTETFTVTSGNVTQIAGTTVDGQTPAINDLVLIKDAPATTGVGSPGSTQPGNGLYQVTANTTNLTVTRAADMSGTANLPAGAFVFVEGGTANGSSGWVVSVPSTNSAFTYGTNNIKWTQFSGAGEITAGTALSKTGNTLNVTTVPLANGGTGQTSQQAALDALAGAVTTGQFLRGNGTHVTLQALQAADIPTNENVAPGSLASGQKFGVIWNGTITGDGTTTAFTVTHNLNNTHPHVQVWDSASPDNVVQVDIKQGATAANQSVIVFATAPTSSLVYNVTAIG